MIYVISFFVGVLNGLFASGAGQFLVFYLIYFLKVSTHMTRALSVCAISISSVFAIFGYSSFVEFDIRTIVMLVIVATFCGFIGTRLMKKINSNYLNLISGVLIVSFTLYKVFFGGA